MATPQSLGPKKRKPSSPFSAKAAVTNFMDEDALRLLHQMQEILSSKAPEVLPLLEEFVSKLPLLSHKIIEAEKRPRSVVISGIPEAEATLPALKRQEHTERYVYDILNSLDVETRPLEIYRMGKIYFLKPIACAPFPTTRASLQSMTPEERVKDRELRSIAREKNRVEGKGKRIYVVYRNEVVKAADIQSDPGRFPKSQ
ncbi:hypothetical protein OESDEN_20403 [Oesophagostomum dentatum]|uniref:Uncharacterized protein n=1 Tax=Oesophagostomum dentatum TaxID=61180 RepID=A0A0B1S9M4_OESDE|nr:hypothetical protein OESDEN_20403 [Oesophagostomum dentatum]